MKTVGKRARCGKKNRQRDLNKITHEARALNKLRHQTNREKMGIRERVRRKKERRCSAKKKHFRHQNRQGTDKWALFLKISKYGSYTSESSRAVCRGGRKEKNFLD